MVVERGEQRKNAGHQRAQDFVGKPQASAVNQAVG